MEVPDQVHDSTNLGVKALEVLRVLVQLDVDDSLLEVKCVTHLVEQEGQEEVSPVLVEGEPARHFFGVHALSELVAVGHDVRHVPSDHACDVQEWIEPSLVQVWILEQRQVVLKIHNVVEHEEDVVEARVRKVIPVRQFQTQKERVGVVVLISRSKGRQHHLVTTVTAGLLESLVQQKCLK